MKFSSNISLFIAVALSNTLATKAKLMIRDEINNPSSDLFQCQKNIIEVFEPCTSKNITKETIDDICSTFKSEKCQKLFNSNITSIEGCEHITEDITPSINNLINIYTSQLELLCEKDENGKLCPLGESFINESNKKPNMTEIDETCKSKKCTDLSIKVLSSYNSLDTINQKLELNQLFGLIPNSTETDKDNNSKILTSLSTNCTTSAQSSDAITSAEITISSTLLGILLFLLYLF